LSVLLTLALPSCRPEGAQSWGYVATLGDDTTSIEWITQHGNQITGDAVGRSPAVVKRHWETTLGPDGTVRRWVMDTRIANAPAGQQELHHELERSGGKIQVVRRTGRANVERTVREPRTRTVPWNAFLYATYDRLIQDARGLPDSATIGIYFFEGWEEGKLGYARLRPLGDGRISVMSTGLAGSGVAEVDSLGRMVAYSGAGTTYKQEVHRVASVPALDSLYQRYAADELARGTPRALSVRDTARGAIGNAQITVDYSRPLRRGRVLVGDLIPYGQVWRTGANAATQLTTTSPIRLGGVPLDSGTYTLWTLPTGDGVQLIINGEHGQWGTEYQARYDIARVPMTVETLAEPVEEFTILVDSAARRLVMQWGRFRWSVAMTASKR
jgi:hypothetical protein